MQGVSNLWPSSWTQFKVKRTSHTAGPDRPALLAQSLYLDVAIGPPGGCASCVFACGGACAGSNRLGACNFVCNAFETAAREAKAAGETDPVLARLSLYKRTSTFNYPPQPRRHRDAPMCNSSRKYIRSRNRLRRCWRALHKSTNKNF